LSSEKKRQTDRCGPGYLEVVIIALIMAGSALFAYDQLFVQKIKTLDLKGYLRSQKSLLVTGAISETQWKENLDRLEQTINQEAADANSIIVLKEVVLRNGNEIIIKE